MAHEKAIAEGFDALWGKSLERNWIMGRLGLPGGGSPVFDVPGKTGYKYVNRGAEGELGQVIARDRVGVTNTYNQRVRMRREFGEYVIRDAEDIAGGGGGATNLNALTDVTLTSPSNGQVLSYNSGSAQWVNFTPSGGTVYTGGAAIDISGSNVISVKVNTSSAIVVDTGTNTLLVNVGDGIKITTNLLTLNLAANPGLEFSVGQVRVKTGNGITRDSTGIILNLATDPGLEYGTGADAGKVRVKAYFGIDRTSNGIGIDLKTTSGLVVDATGLAVGAGNGIDVLTNSIAVKPKTTSGLVLDAAGLAVGAGDGIDVLTTTVAVDVTDIIDTAAGLREDGANNIQVRLETNSGLQFGGAGGVQLGTPGTLTVSTVNQVLTTTHAHAITSSSDVGTSPLASILASNSSGQLTLAQLTLRGNLIFAGGDRSITASNSLTLAPSTDLILDPTGLVLLPNAQEMRTSSFTDAPTGIVGMRMWDRGSNYRQLTLGALKADEMYVRVFVADEVRIDRGEEFWSKSYGVVETDFVLPADEVTVDVWFENAPGLAAANLFTVNDWLLARTIDWDTSLAIEKVWFQAVSLLTAGSVDGYRQQWRIRRKSGGTTSTVVKKGNTLLDAGQTGQGLVYLSALRQDGGPFIKVGDFSSVSSDVPQFTYRAVFGNLNGSVDYAVDTYGTAAGNNIGTAPSAGFSGYTVDATNGLRLFNTALAFYDSGVKMIRFDKDTGLTLDIDVSEEATFGRYIRWQDDVDSLDPESNARVGAWKVGLSNKLGIKVISPDLATDSFFSLVLQRSIDSVSSNFNMNLTLAEFDLSSGKFVFSGTGALFTNMAGLLVTNVGGPTSPSSLLHVYANDALTSAAAGVTIEQVGAGDALLQFYLTATRRWVVGIDNSDSDKFKISNNAALGSGDVLAIDTSGYVGIGTAAPTALLHVVQTSGSDYALTVQQNNGGATGTAPVARFGYNPGTFGLNLQEIITAGLVKYSWGVINNSVSYPDMLIFDRGNIGIGTTTPGSALDVVGAVNVSGGGTFGSNILLEQAAATNAIIRSRNLNAGAANAAEMRALTAAVDMRFIAYASGSAGSRAGLAFANAGEFLVATGDKFLITALPAIPIHFLTNTAVRMTILGTGEVGIGTTSAASRLHVYENTAATTTAAGVTIEQNGAGDAKLQFLLTGGQRWGIGIDNSTANDYLVIAPGTDLGTTPYLAIGTSPFTGDIAIGIGTSTPGIDVIGTFDTSAGPLLQIDGSGPTLLFRGSSGGGLIQFIHTGATSGQRAAAISSNLGRTRFTVQSDTLGTNFIPLHISHADGYIGINELAPEAQLDVGSEDTNVVRSSVYGPTNWFNYVSRRALTSKASPSAVQLNTIMGAWGAVGYSSSGWPTVASAQIQLRASENYTSTGRGSKVEFYTTLNGTTTLSKAVTIENDGGVSIPYIWANAVNGTAVQINSNGTLTKATSSIRFKKNVRELPGDFGDDFIMALRPIVYNNKFGDDANDYVGFVAEDVFDIGGKPFISFNDDGLVESLHYDKLTVPLVAAVQDLIPYKARIAQLEAEMAALRARVDAL